MALRILQTRQLAILQTHHTASDVMSSLQRHIGADASLAEVPEWRITGGWTGRRTFRVRYAGPYGQVAVQGWVREHGKHTTIVLRFREQPVDLLLSLGIAALVGGAWYLWHAKVDWMSVALPVVVGLLSLLLIPSRGTSPGFAGAAVNDIARATDGECR